MAITLYTDFDNVLRNYRQYELVDFRVRKSGKKFLAKKVKLRKNIFKRLIPKFFHNRVMSNNLIKKSVRVDSDMYNTLLIVAHGDETFLTNIINSAVLEEISTKEIDLIDAHLFRNKITVYFTQEEYMQVRDVLDELKDRKIKGITFSSLVRSILYKYLGIVMKASDYVENELNKNTQRNKGKSISTVTNPINHSNDKKQKKHINKNRKGMCYGN